MREMTEEELFEAITGIEIPKQTYYLEIHFKEAITLNGVERAMIGTYMTTTKKEIKDILEHSIIETELDGDIILINTSNVLYTRIKEIEQKKNIRKIYDNKSKQDKKLPDFGV